MHSQVFVTSCFLAFLSGSVGCGDSAPGRPATPNGPTNPDPSTTAASGMRAELAVPHVFSIVVPASMAQVTARRDNPEVDEETTMLPLAGGGLTIAARPDGALALTAMTLDLGTVTLLPSSLPPSGPTLVGVKLSLRAQADAATDWRADGKVAKATVTADLLLDSSLEASSGAAVPLATQRIAGVPINLILAEDKDGRMALTANADKDGMFWQWSAQLELSDLTIALLAAD